MVVRAGTGHRTAALRIGGSGNDEAVDGEVGSEAAVADHRDSARVVGIAVVPVHKVVVVAGRGPQDDVGAFGVGGAAYKYIVASRARHCAAVLRIDGSVDGVSGFRKAGNAEVVDGGGRILTVAVVVMPQNHYHIITGWHFNIHRFSLPGVLTTMISAYGNPTIRNSIV